MYFATPLLTSFFVPWVLIYKDDHTKSMLLKINSFLRCKRPAFGHDAEVGLRIDHKPVLGFLQRRQGRAELKDQDWLI